MKHSRLWTVGSDDLATVMYGTRSEFNCYLHLQLELIIIVSCFLKIRTATRLRGYLHIFDSWTLFKWKFPNFYRPPDYVYDDSNRTHRHRDWFSRVYEGPYDDRYISCYDGKVKKLVVQATDMVYDSTGNGTWRRTFIRNVSPWHLRLANWPMSHVDYMRGTTDEDIPLIAVKWIVASLAMIVTVGPCMPWGLMKFGFADRALTRSDSLARQASSETRVITTHFPTDITDVPKHPAMSWKIPHQRGSFLPKERKSVRLLLVSFDHGGYVSSTSPVSRGYMAYAACW
jgi:hypothetical protein